MTLRARQSRGLPGRERTTVESGYRLKWDFVITQLAEFVDNFRPPYAKTTDDLDALRELPEDWNGYDVEAPNPYAIERARMWIRQMHEDVEAIGRRWHNPHVAPAEEGDVMFEWWNGDKALTVYVSGDDVNYIIGWGPNLETDMEDGEATTSERRRKLWAWLTR